MRSAVPRRPPKIQDVAARAEVSVATVSRVLNGSELVREATRERVQQAIDVLAYRPSWLARDLRQDKTGRVLVLFPSLHSPVMSEVFRGIDDVARTEGYFSLICPTAKERTRERELVQMLTNRSVDGIIFFGTTLDEAQLEELGSQHPVVQVAEWKEVSSTRTVSVDDAQAAYDMTRHLLDLGHVRIAMSTYPIETSSQQRERGYRRALEEAGIEVREDLIFPADYEYSSGREIVRRIAEHDDRPTALFCISDVVAAGAVTEAHERGLRTPQDLAIAGFDDTREALMAVPELTTIRQPFYEIGRHSMQALVHNFSNMGDRLLGHEILPHELVIRGSTVAGAGTLTPARQSKFLS